MSNSQHNDGGPAYPCQPLDAQNNPIGPLECGMTLRDYFAGQALAGDMANESEGVFPNNVSEENLLKRARLLYRIADAMLKAREPHV